MEITKQYFPVAKATIHAYTAGNPDDPVALLLHGIPASGRLWEQIMPGLTAAGWYVIAPDCPGYGETAVHWDSHYRLDGSADLFLEWIEQEGWTDIWLIGHDLGGGIAQIMVTRGAKFFQKLSLSNCATARSWPVPIIRLMIWMAKQGLFPFLAITGLAQLFGKTSLRKAFYQKHLPDQKMVERYFFDEKMTSAAGRKKFARLLCHLSSDDTSENMAALARVRLPVHLIWAMDDPHQPYALSGKILEETLEEVRITYLEQTSHFLQLDNPRGYLKALLSPLD